MGVGTRCFQRKGNHRIWWEIFRFQNLSLITVFQHQYTPTRNIYYILAEFSEGKQKPNETQEQHWKKLGDLEKVWVLKSIRPAEVTVQNNILSTTDREMMVETIDVKEINVNLVIDRPRQDTLDKTHDNEFIPTNEIERRKAKQQNRGRRYGENHPN